MSSRPPRQAGTFKTLLAAAQAAGLADALATTQNITVFAPTDEAFAKLPAGTVENLLKPENKDQLVAILTYHVVPRKLASNQMLAGPFHVRTLKAKPDRTLAITKGAGGVTVDNATVDQGRHHDGQRHHPRHRRRDAAEQVSETTAPSFRPAAGMTACSCSMRVSPSA